MPLGSPSRRPMRFWALGAIVVLLGGGGWLALGPTASADTGVESAEVVRGDFIDVLPIRGEVRARRTVPIVAPRGAGDLQIVFLAPSGAAVKAGDVVIRFDTSTAERQLAEKRSALREAEAEIQRARADNTISAQATRSDETKRRYDVERAKLDVSTSEVISRLDAEKAAISLGAAEQRAREAAMKVTANEATSRAGMGALERRREKALADVRLEETRLAALTLKAPADGVVTLGLNWRAGGPFAQREWRAGDRAWAGAGIAQIAGRRVALRPRPGGRDGPRLAEDRSRRRRRGPGRRQPARPGADHRVQRPGQGRVRPDLAAAPPVRRPARSRDARTPPCGPA